MSTNKSSKQVAPRLRTYTADDFKHPIRLLLEAFTDLIRISMFHMEHTVLPFFGTVFMFLIVVCFYLMLLLMCLAFMRIVWKACLQFLS